MKIIKFFSVLIFIIMVFCAFGCKGNRGGTITGPELSDFQNNQQAPNSKYVEKEDVVLKSNCPGISPNDWIPDDDGLQKCLDGGGEITLDPGFPGYVIQKGLKMKVNWTCIRTVDGVNTKAILIAHSFLRVNLIETVGSVNNIALKNIIIDGNKKNRVVDNCAGFPRPSNIVINGNEFEVSNIESKNTLCGTALGVAGSDFTVKDNLIKDNGFGSVFSILNPVNIFGPEPWSDGITVGDCRGGTVSNNIVEDSSDIGIVVAGGGECTVSNNKIYQNINHAFAGLAVHNFMQGGQGFHFGSKFENNIIKSAPGMMDFGISVGIHSWDSNLNTSGGIIRNNFVSGATINLAVDGYSGGTILDNVLNGPEILSGMDVVDCASFKANYTIAHINNVCLQAHPNPKFMIFDVGFPCRQEGNACKIAEQIKDDCPVKEAWKIRCEIENEHRGKPRP